MSLYFYEFVIIPNHEHGFKYEKLADQIFSELKTLIHELICVKNNSYAASIKNDNRAVAMRKMCDAKITNSYINFKKYNIGEYNTC